ncbi:hypothetical protein F53441_5384 [Fusarium austroafricanum]|uniref:Uncharacterized protein n=1 Tax=Fusarium austroafricanum TaxID=2364996 RepID=A0A8H4KI36_9HYPO|nr:hypothetical protein F53441_5384 [Fusarium austroafricanum]
MYSPGFHSHLSNWEWVTSGDGSHNPLAPVHPPLLPTQQQLPANLYPPIPAAAMQNLSHDIDNLAMRLHKSSFNEVPAWSANEASRSLYDYDYPPPCSEYAAPGTCIRGTRRHDERSPWEIHYAVQPGNMDLLNSSSHHAQWHFIDHLTWCAVGPTVGGYTTSRYPQPIHGHPQHYVQPGHSSNQSLPSIRNRGMHDENINAEGIDIMFLASCISAADPSAQVPEEVLNLHAAGVRKIDPSIYTVTTEDGAMRWAEPEVYSPSANVHKKSDGDGETVVDDGGSERLGILSADDQRRHTI